MRFKASVQNLITFTKFTASLASLGPVAWVRLDESEVRFTIIPEQGTQVWAVLKIDAIFEEDYHIQSAADNIINLEVPLGPLQRALKSALTATSTSIRLTKKDGIPVLSLTIITASLGGGMRGALGTSRPSESYGFGEASRETQDGRERETVVTQDVPVRVLDPSTVQGIHQPRCREPDVHILFPSLVQLKSVCDRFTRLASASKANGTSGNGGLSPRLEMAANMHGCLRLSIRTDAMNISSVWTGLANPELDPSQVEGGEEGVRQHPSTKMKGLGSADGRSEDGWATVRIDGRDWSRVMSVGRLSARVIACFCHEHALILYVYLCNDDVDQEGSVLTYYVGSYSE